MTKPMREYQREWRNKHRPRKNGKPRRSILADMQIIVAWVAGEISEGATMQLLDVDRIEARRMKSEAIAGGKRQWKEFREKFPV